MQEFTVFQGRKTLTLQFPDRWDVADVSISDEEPLKNPEDKMMRVLKNPIASLPLGDIVKPADQIAICVTGHSKYCPDFIVLPPILAELSRAGIPATNITILVGSGVDRPLTFDEMKARFGYNIVSNYRIVNHETQGRSALVEMGATFGGVPRVINSLLAFVNHIISVGVVDLHQYAGFSGGAQTVATGCTGEETIKELYSVSFIEKSNAAPGKIKGNLFQEALWEIVEPLPFDFSVNLILNDRGEVVVMEAGDPMSVHAKVVEEAEKRFIADFEAGFDIAFIGVPSPKDQSLYQATRAATYQALVERSALRKDAVINLYCTTPEGFGKSIFEKRFKDRLTKMPNPPAVLLSMMGKNTLPGEQRAYVTAKTMLNNPINLVGSSIEQEELVKAHFMSMPAVTKTMEAQDVRALVIKDGTRRIARLKDKRAED